MVRRFVFIIWNRGRSDGRVPAAFKFLRAGSKETVTTPHAADLHEQSDLAIGLSQFPAEIEAEIFEEADFDLRIRDAERGEARNAEEVA